MKILFVTPHLKMGGIANSLYNLLWELRKDPSLVVELVCFNPIIDKKFQKLSEKFKIHNPRILQYLLMDIKEAKEYLSKYEFLGFLLCKTISKLIGTSLTRKAVARFIYPHWNKQKTYNIAISFSNDIPKSNIVLGANHFVKYSVSARQKIAWIHNDLEKLGITASYIKKMYSGFDKIVNVSKSCKKDFETLAPEFIQKSYLVHNHLDSRHIIKKSQLFNPYEGEEVPVIFVTVARIANEQKRIDRILKIVEKLKYKKYQFKWYVVGDGPDLSKLKKQAIDKNLIDRLKFVGYQKNPYPYIKYANCFVLTSLYEAQGMVLSEALIVGTPVVTTDFPAAKEFVKDDNNGKIVANNAESIYRVLKFYLENPDAIQELKNNLDSGKLILNSEQSLLEFKNLIGEQIKR